MATIGHTCVGLSLSCLSSARGRRGRLAHIWPGLMVLMAHLVDIAEWVVVVAAPTYFDEHFVTNSPVLTGLLVVAVWALLAFVGRVRRPWPYLLIVAAVFSHLLLDHHLARQALTDTYGAASAGEEPSLQESLIAETWSYGLLLVLASLGRAAWQKDCPRKGRAAAGLLAVAAVFAATTRHPAVWVPVYALAAAHALMLMRRALGFRFLWNLVPVTPIFALLVMELYAGHFCRQADAFSREGDYARAEVLYRRALEVPTRSRNVGARIHLSWCQRQTGDLGGAVATLRYAMRVSEYPSWPAITLAELLICPEAKGTPYYSPQEAAVLLRQVIAGPSNESHTAQARHMLNALRRTGALE
jgi:hypothetical protein